MLAIRLLRVGKKNQPVFRVVVTDKKNPPRGGRFVEVLGFYNPITKEKSLKAERIKYWLSVGAQPSDTIHNLLITEKIIEGKKIPVHSIKKEPSLTSAAEGKETAKVEEKKEEAVMEKSEAESPKKEPEEAPKEEKPEKKQEEEPEGQKEESSFVKTTKDKEKGSK